MGIDRHEWEHRNYKSGRVVKAAPALQPTLEDDSPEHDASLGDVEAAAPAVANSDKAKASSTKDSGSKTPSSKASNTTKAAASKPAAKDAPKAAKGKVPAKKAARAG